MKTSRRHRWVRFFPGGIGTSDISLQALCRDCGLEVMQWQIKGGGFGPCVGKACEHQHNLALMNLSLQNIGNTEPVTYIVACVGCGNMGLLQMLGHRNDQGQLTGWIFSCGNCLPVLADSQVICAPKRKCGR